MNAFGIDLGTTNSCVSYVDDTGRPVVAKNQEGKDTTPSVVQFESGGNVVVGSTAKEFAKLDPNSVVALIKRSMGEQIDFEFEGVPYTPESVSALILKELAASASKSTGEPVQDVVITVPAYFGLAEKEATRKAGEIAGLNVLDLIPEPVAAAIDYEVMGDGGSKTVLVYDLGGGTFDTTAIRIEDNDIRVICTDGNHRLGGADWDARLSDYLVEQFEAEHPDSDAGSNDQFLQDAMLSAETLKQSLSQANSRPHHMYHHGESTSIEISREKLDDLTSDLLDETMEITERTINTAKEKGYDHFDEVLLVGGSSLMPAVSTELEKRFGFSPRLHDPHLAVAKGAALYATIASIKIQSGDSDASKAQAVADVSNQTGLTPEAVIDLRDKSIVTVAPRAFGVKVVDSDSAEPRLIVEHLILANDPLPAAPSQTFATVANNQTEIQIEVREQLGVALSVEVEDNEFIGDGFIRDIPPLPAGSPVEICFQLSDTGRLDVTAVEKTHNGTVTFEIQIGGMSDAQVDEAKQIVEGLQVRS